jgi:putative ABC transport system substrate-binding protein
MKAPRRAATAALACALLALPLLGAAQPAGPAPGVHRVGVFHVGDHVPPGLPPLRDRLAALGYREGSNLRLEFRNLADEAAARETARAFVRDGVDVIVAFGNPTIRAAKAATARTPIVMVHATDPVAEGFVAALARPGGNVTGFVFFAVSPGKHLELMREMVPGLRRVLVLTDPGDPVSRRQLVELRAAARSLKALTLVEREATDRAGLERIVRSLGPGEVDGVVPASVNLQIRFTSLLVRLAADRRLPLASYRKDAALQGALFSYAPDDAAVGRRAAEHVHRILGGARPADLPVELPTEVELVVNVRTAEALGLTLPPSILARAHQLVR